MISPTSIDALLQTPPRKNGKTPCSTPDQSQSEIATCSAPPRAPKRKSLFIDNSKLFTLDENCNAEIPEDLYLPTLKNLSPMLPVLHTPSRGVHIPFVMRKHSSSTNTRTRLHFRPDLRSISTSYEQDSVKLFIRYEQKNHGKSVRRKLAHF